MANYSFISRVLYRQSRAILSRIPRVNIIKCQHSTLRRAALYVPGYELDKLKEAIFYKLDCLIMDCEDVEDRKVEARETIKQLLDEKEVMTGDLPEDILMPEWCVRVNPVQCPDLCEADLEVLLSAKSLPCSICLPKITNVDQLQWFAEKVWSVVVKRKENDRGPLKLIMLIESPEAILNLTELCKKAEDLSTMAPIVPVALMFERASLCALLGIAKTESELEVFHAKQKLVLTAYAFGLQAIDSVSLNSVNIKKLELNCKHTAMLGFTGLQIIHQNQIVTVQNAFIPSRQKIKWAEKLIYTYERQIESTKTKLNFKNDLVTVQMLRQANIILKTAKIEGKVKKVRESAVMLIK